jgi:hypothetical protein
VTATVNNAWDGAYEDGALPRPGRKNPFAYTIQPADDPRDGYTWGLHTQGNNHRTVVASGTARTVDGARAAAADAALAAPA